MCPDVLFESSNRRIHVLNVKITHKNKRTRLVMVNVLGCITPKNTTQHRKWCHLSTVRSRDSFLEDKKRVTGSLGFCGMFGKCMNWIHEKPLQMSVFLTSSTMEIFDVWRCFDLIGPVHLWRSPTSLDLYGFIFIPFDTLCLYNLWLLRMCQNIWGGPKAVG